jgi:glutamine amidotransferase
MKNNNFITIIDYDMGNVGSIRNMILRLGGNVKISRRKEEILKSDKIILPGVGSFDTGIKNLKKLGLFEILKDISKRKNKFLLGVCLGMQLLTKKSQEGSEKGLGLIDGETIRFSFNDHRLKIPHMGWNKIKMVKENKLFINLNTHNRFYFVHSYHVKCNDFSDVSSVTFYGYDFVSSINKENIYGTQFHPEKSHKFGMIIYKNFIRMVC